MKNRIITGAFIFALLLCSLLLFHTIAFYLVVCFLCVSAVYEIFVATKYQPNRLLLAVSMLYALAAPFFETTFFGVFTLRAIDGITVYTIVVFLIMLHDHARIPIEKIALVYMLSLTIPLAFSSMIYIKNLTQTPNSYPYAGLFYIVLIFIGSWITDVFAYFTGRLLGRHKLAPAVSPKKTVEGAIGGAVGCLLFFGAVALAFEALVLKDHGHVNLLPVLLIALPCAVAGMLGDLVASTIKRSLKIKDFGSLMPGHGGIMDRFDSLILLAPLVFAVARYLPLVTIH